MFHINEIVEFLCPSNILKSTTLAIVDAERIAKWVTAIQSIEEVITKNFSSRAAIRVVPLERALQTYIRDTDPLVHPPADFLHADDQIFMLRARAMIPALIEECRALLSEVGPMFPNSVSILRSHPQAQDLLALSSYVWWPLDKFDRRRFPPSGYHFIFSNLLHRFMIRLQNAISRTIQLAAISKTWKIALGKQIIDLVALMKSCIHKLGPLHPWEQPDAAILVSDNQCSISNAMGMLIHIADYRGPSEVGRFGTMSTIRFDPDFTPKWPALASIWHEEIATHHQRRT